MSETILEKNAVDSYKQDMILYSMVVNRKRSIPDAKDGLKPVQRRILYGMFKYEHAITTNVKSAAIVGTVMKTMHPHGDTSIYDAMRPLANWFECKMPLISPEGNWGTFMGDGAAAARYTEAKLSPFGYECVIGELKDSLNVVDWSNTYDDKNKEPDYLPTKVPLLIINGTNGIGVGMCTDIPKHNLHEVIETTRALIKNPEAEVILIPDHCLNCNIIDTDWKSISETGNGKYKVRGIIEIGEYGKLPALFVRSLPDRTSTISITDKLEKMVEEKQLPMIREIIDASKETNLNIIIQLVKGADPYYVKEILYKKTDIEKSFSINFEVVNGINPMRFNYRQYLLSFIEQRKITMFRMYCNKLQQVMTRYHQLETFVKVIDSGEIDNIIKMIQKQTKIDEESTIEYLIKKCKITDLQAKFIINTNIKYLSKAYCNKYKEEIKELVSKRKAYEDFVTDDKKILDTIDKQLEDIDKRYSTPRTCKVIKVSDDSNIPKGTFKIVVTENNYIRKLSLDDKATSVKGDNPKFIIKVENDQNILLFDNKGKVFKLPVHKVPLTERGSDGVDIRLMVRGLTANICSVLYEPDLQEVAKFKKAKHYLTVVTADNYIKKLDLDDFLNVPLSGTIYTKISSSEDEVRDVKIIPEALDVIVYSGHKALRLPMKEIPNYKRASQGVFAMNSKERISGLSVVYPNATHILILTDSGKVNKYDIIGLPKSVRNKAGNTVIKLAKTDSIIGIYGVNDSNKMAVVTRGGRVEFDVKDIPVRSSVSSGVKLLGVKSDPIVKADIIL